MRGVSGTARRTGQAGGPSSLPSIYVHPISALKSGHTSLALNN